MRREMPRRIERKWHGRGTGSGGSPDEREWLKRTANDAFQKTTDSNHGGPVAENVLDKDFTADGPD
jgi:hypothetical protein